MVINMLMDMEGLRTRGKLFLAAAKDVLPGLLTVIMVAVLARFVHSVLPIALQKIVGEVVIGLSFGMILGNVGLRKPLLLKGLNFAFNYLLKWAIVMLAVQITVGVVLATGAAVVGLVVALMIIATLVSISLGKLVNISPHLSSLIAVGTSVCGNTAISAVAPVIKAKDNEVAFAIATNTLFGTLGLFLYPVVGSFLGLSQTMFGAWAGLAINDTSQVVAAGTAFGVEAGKVATTVKLTRNALLGVVVIVAGILATRLNSQTEQSASKVPWYVRLKLPSFVVAFLCVAAINSLGVFAWLERALLPGLVNNIIWFSKLLIVISLVAVGFKTDLRSMTKIGLRPFLVGLVTWLINACVALGGLYLLFSEHV